MKKNKKNLLFALILLFLAINCREKNPTNDLNVNKYLNLVDPDLIKFLLPTNEIWISSDEKNPPKKILENGNFKDSGYPLHNNTLFEIIGVYPSFENTEYYLVYQHNEFFWISSKIKKDKPKENIHIKSFYLQQADFIDSEMLVIKSNFKLGEIDVYEQPDFKSKILANVKEDEVHTIGKYVPIIKNINPMKILAVTDKKDRYFDKLGNWINISYKNISGFVFSSEVVPLVENCADYPNLKKSDNIFKNNDIININGNNIETTFWYGTNCWGIVLKSENEYSLALAKLASYCREDSKYRLVKIIDVKNFSKPETTYSYESVMPQMSCKNGEYSGDHLFVIFNGQNTANDVRHTYYIDTRNEKIIELNSSQTTCKDVCDDQSGCD